MLSEFIVFYMHVCTHEFHNVIPLLVWCYLLTNDIMTCSVLLLSAETIYPVQNPNALRDPRIPLLIQYAMKVEKTMFETASSRDEYYQLLAEKIYRICMELEKRRKLKMEMENRRMSVGGTQTCACTCICCTRGEGLRWLSSPDLLSHCHCLHSLFLFLLSSSHPPPERTRREQKRGGRKKEGREWQYSIYDCACATMSHKC